jgi:DUF4097 and DUF4098 domain-containing protein YvlB
MRRLLIIILLPFFFYACDVADVWDDNVRAEKSESRSFSSSQIQKVEIETQNGSIESSVWDDDSVYLVFEKWATGDDREEAKDNLSDIKIYISEDTGSGVLRIDVDFPKRGWEGTNYGCNVSLSLPSSLSLDLKSSNGAITVSGSQNGFECLTSNGPITAQDTQGGAELRTSNGKITVRDHYGELNGRTSNGGIDVDIVLPRQGECILKTSNGAITLSIPDETSAMIEASTSNGGIEIDNLDATIVKIGKTEFRGKIGRGEGNIDLETSNGSILVKGM